MTHFNPALRRVVLNSFALFLVFSLSGLQASFGFGKPIGKVSTRGDLIVVELDRDVLGKKNLFDLAGRTLRFTPAGLRYRVQNEGLRWNEDTGTRLAGAEVALHQFSFPFSDR